MLAFSARLAGLQQHERAVLDLYEFMTDRDLENLVFVYLQVKGWYVLPGTRTPDTAHYEFVLVNRETGERSQARLGLTLHDTPAKKKHSCLRRQKITE
jgi:hypothetical protein